MSQPQPSIVTLPPNLVERDILQAAQEREFITESDLEAARSARLREARHEVYRSLLEHLIDAGAMTASQLARLGDDLSNLERVDEPAGFQFIEKLGNGSMGTVYLAWQKNLNRKVAVKLLSRQYSRNKQYVERFDRESKIAALTASPYLPHVFAAGQSRGQHYLAMEFIEGESIAQRLAGGQPMPLGVVIELGIEVTYALEHLHALLIVHRDIKPQNIVITRDGHLKVMDLGLARKLGDQAQFDAEQGNAIGTPYYISPEQARGDAAVDVRSDLYSLGATLYHMLTGRVPFSEPHTWQILNAHLHNAPEPPGDLVDGIPHEMDRLVLRLLEKDPQQRVSSAVELREELTTLESQL